MRSCYALVFLLGVLSPVIARPAMAATGTTVSAHGVTVWASESRFTGDMSFVQKTQWQTLPAAGLPGPLGGDPVIATGTVLAAFDSEAGGAAFYTREGDRLRKRCLAMPDPAARPVGYELVAGDQKSGPGIAVYSGQKRLEYTVYLSRDGIVEFRPAQAKRLVVRDCATAYGMVPSFIGTDLLYDPRKCPADRVYIPSMNFYVGLVKGNDCVMVGVWPPGGQCVSLGLKGAGEERVIDSLAIDLDQRSLYLSWLAGANIWHCERLKETYLERDTVIGWQRPFDAKWIGRFFIKSEGINYPFYFRQGQSGLWGRFMRDQYSCPFWFDKEKTYVHFEKKFPPEGEALIYYLEPYTSVAPGGWITEWMVAEPYTAAGKTGPELFAVEFEPETSGKANWKLVTGKGVVTPWRGQLQGNEGDNQVSYMRAEIWSSKAQEARLEIGCEAGIKAWLNGKVVHANNALRGCSDGEDKAQAVSLKEGWNPLMVKVTQGGGGWEGSVHVRAADGSALAGLRFRADSHVTNDEAAGKPRVLASVPSPVGVMQKALGKEVADKLLDFQGIKYRPLVEHGRATCSMGDELRRIFEEGIDAPFVTAWQFAAHTEPWTNVKAFVEMTPEKRKAIEESAAKAPLIESPGGGGGNRANRVDFLSRFPEDKRTNIAGYVMRTVRAKKPMKVRICTGSDDALRIWVNGVKVTERLLYRGAEQESESVLADLREGDNTLLVEVSQGTEGWGLYLRLEHENGNSIELADTGEMTVGNDAGRPRGPKRGPQAEQYAGDLPKFVMQIHDRIFEYADLAKRIKQLLEREKKADPELASAVQRIEQTIAEIENQVRRAPAVSSEELQKWAEEMKKPCRKFDGKLIAACSDLANRCAGLAGNQDEITRDVSVLAIRLTEQAAELGQASKKRVRLAEQIITQSRQVMRCATWWEPTRIYLPKCDPGSP